MFEPVPLVHEPIGKIGVALRAAEHAAEVWRLVPPQLHRVGSNAVFFCDDTVLRVSRSSAPMTVALRFAERLDHLGIRSCRPARSDSLRAGNGLSVTAWQRIHFDPTAQVDWERVGVMIARVHAIDPAGVDHPLPFCGEFPWWNLELMLGEADAEIVDDAARDAMLATWERHRWWFDVARAAPMSLCHGDVHPGNVLVDDDGPVLIDWDLLSVGPIEWDHSALLLWEQRWGGERGMFDAFASGYGAPVEHEVLNAIAQLRLLVATLMRLRRARDDDTHAPEALRRLAYWRGDPDAEMWQAQ